MATKQAQKIFSDIKALKIQGAEKVANSSLDALLFEARASKARNRKEFLAHMFSAVLWLRSSRPTEPALRNALRFVFSELRKSKADAVAELKSVAAKEIAQYEASSAKMKKKIAEYGARLVPDGGKVLVHCHSSTLVGVLKRAKELGKEFEVFALETRPLYQGRVTAREVAQAGIKCNLSVDSAAQFVLREKMLDTDVVMAGADAISSEGDLYNKIGTSQVALAAREHDKKFFSCAGTHKFDPLTLWGEEERIEMRAPEEVAVAKDLGLKKLPAKLRVLNPAFDLTEARLINAYVTEIGLIPPQAIATAVWKEFRLSEEKEF